MTQIRLQVVGYPDSDDEERADLAWRLREEMLDRGVDDVSHPSLPSPEGAKGGAVEWAQLIVTLVGTVPPMIMALEGWLGRHPKAAFTLEIDGDKLTVENASDEDGRRMVEAFMARHGGG